MVHKFMPFEKVVCCENKRKTKAYKYVIIYANGMNSNSES